MERIRVHTSELMERAKTLRAGDQLLLSGTIYTARDAAHKRICAQLDRGEEPPFPIQGSTVYYAGPTPAPEGLPIGACGPTTSSRMDVFAPRLLGRGTAPQPWWMPSAVMGLYTSAPSAVPAHWRPNVCAV